MNKKKLVLTSLLWALFIYIIHMFGYVVALLYHLKGGGAYETFFLPKMSGDILLYVTQIKESYINGFNLFQTDPYIFEYSSKEFANGNFIYAFASLFLYLSSDINILFFTAPLFSIILSVFLVRGIIINQYNVDVFKESKFSFFVILSVLFLSSYDNLFNIPAFVKILIGIDYVPNNVHDYNYRFPHIQFSILFLILWYYTIVLFLKNKKVKHGILLGGTLAVLQYSYFYFWTATVIYTAIVLIVHAKSVKQFFLYLTWVFGVYFLLTIPFWMAFVSFNQSDFADQYAYRIGKHFDLYNPRGEGVALLSIVLLIFDGFFYHINNKHSNRFSITDFQAVLRLSQSQLILAIVTVFFLNIQVLIGYTIQSYHWLFTFYYPILIIVGFEYLVKLKSLFKQIKNGQLLNSFRIGLISFLFLMIISAFVNNYQFGKIYSSRVVLAKSQSELIMYIKDNIPTNSVFMSSEFGLPFFINATTKNKSFIPYSFASLCTDQELIERTFIGYTSMGYSIAQIKNGFKYGNKTNVGNEDREVNQALFGMDNLLRIFTYTYKDIKEGGYIYPDKLELMIEEVIVDLDYNKYKLDYIIYSKVLNKSMNIDPEKIVFNNKDYVLVKL